MRAIDHDMGPDGRHSTIFLSALPNIKASSADRAEHEALQVQLYYVYFPRATYHPYGLTPQTQK